MKAIIDRLPHRAVPWGAWVDWACKWCCLCCCCLLFPQEVGAQCDDARLRLHAGERVDYDLYFKWGLLMPRAGSASLSVERASFEGTAAWRYRMLFQTTGMFEKIYSMRDTLDCYYARPSGCLLFSTKHSDEKDYYLVDDLRFSYFGDSVRAHSHRYTLTRTKIDTLLTAQACLFDMLGATMHLRTLDWSTFSPGAEFPFRIAIGRDVVHASFRYTGQQIVERGEVKYRTRHFYIDIFDEAFTQSKAAAEVWIGDDANHIPVKIRAKLKIGAAEVYYKESHGLREPLTCRIELP
ncbi:MAG: DUF3108 domain-containing protein [Parabacteroides sp.]